MNEDEDEFANPEEEGGCEDGTSTGTRKEGNQPDSTNPPFFRLALSEHLSSLQQGSSSQTTRDTVSNSHYFPLGALYLCGTWFSILCMLCHAWLRLAMLCYA